MWSGWLQVPAIAQISYGTNSSLSENEVTTFKVLSVAVNKMPARSQDGEIT